MRPGYCRLCCGVLFLDVTIDPNGQPSFVSEDTEVECERYGTKYSIRCPHCSAKNTAVQMSSPGGSYGLEIVAAVMEDE